MNICHNIRKIHVLNILPNGLLFIKNHVERCNDNRMKEYIYINLEFSSMLALFYIDICQYVCLQLRKQ